MFRELVILNASASPAPPSIYPLPDEPVNTDTPYSDEALTPFTPDSRFVIVGANTIDGDVRAGVYSILDKDNLTLVSEGNTNSTTVSGGYSITWAVNSQNLSCTVGANNDKMWLNILRNIQGRDIRISATINGNGVSNKTIYFDVNATYAPANFVIRNIDDWLLLKTAIEEQKESYYYSNATTGCANKRFRLDCDLAFNHSLMDYSIGFRNYTTYQNDRYFGGVFDGADHTITLSGTHSITDTARRCGGVFEFVKAARILNMNLEGSLTSSRHVGGLVAVSTSNSSFERIRIKANVESTNNAASVFEHGGSYVSKTATSTTFSASIKDIFVCGYAKADINAGLISVNEIRNGTRCIAIGKTESKNQANPVKSGWTINDAVKSSSALFVKDFFSKAIVVKGGSGLRGCFQWPTNISPQGGISNILDLNQKASGVGMIFKISDSGSGTVTNCHSLQNSYGSGAWSYINGTNIASFAAAVATDYFSGDSNWIKGVGGANIINNQYATDEDVLLAAKDENYYGGY